MGGAAPAAGSGPLAPSPCALDKKVGGFAFTVTPPADNAVGHSELGGSIYDAVAPSDVWTTKATEGSCRLTVGPKLSCTADCASMGQSCGASGSCVPAPVVKAVGAVTLSGLLAALPPAKPFSNGSYYAPVPSTAPFPPFAVEDVVTLETAGGDYPGFTLHGRGIDPLDVPTMSFDIKTDQDLTVSWTPPSKAGSATVSLSLDLGHHGSVSAKLICDVPDTGSAVVPKGLLTQLAAEGVAGFPSMTITRHTMDSTMIAPGCVEFDVASSLNRELTFPGLVSCSCSGMTCAPCTATQTCVNSACQ